MRKFDELASLIRGFHFLNCHFPDECYYWKNPTTEAACKVPFPLGDDPYPYIIVNIGSGVSILLVESSDTFHRIGGTSVGKSAHAGVYIKLIMGVLKIKLELLKRQPHRMDLRIFGGAFLVYILDTCTTCGCGIRWE